MKPLPRPLLLVVTDRSQLAGGAPALGPLADAAFAAGCRWISLREKDLPADDQLALARDLVRRAAPFGARVTVHGSPDIAHAAGADGVHLPENGAAAPARRLLGPAALIGQSVHGPEQAHAVDPAVVDYVVAGPAFLTASKPGYGPALYPDRLMAIVRASPVPVVAIGGIGPDNASACLAAGAGGIAVMGTVMRAAQPGTLVADLLARLPA